jgi:hypothetical protein
MQALIITSTLLALTSGVPALVHVEADPALAPSLQRALALRGVSTTTNPATAQWHVTVHGPSDPDDPVTSIAIQRPGSPASVVRLVAEPRVTPETRVRNLALIIAQHTALDGQNQTVGAQDGTVDTPNAATDTRNARSVSPPRAKATAAAALAAAEPAPKQTTPARREADGAVETPPAETPTVERQPAEPSATRETAATAVARRTPEARSDRGFYLRLDTEVSYFDQGTYRLGPMLGLGYRFGRWAVELAAGYHQGLGGSPESSEPGPLVFDGVSYPSYSEGYGSVAYIDHVTPGSGFIGRAALTYDLWRSRSLTLRLGLAAEVDVNKPRLTTPHTVTKTYFGASPNVVPWIALALHRSKLRPTLRFGWRQPLGGLQDPNVTLYANMEPVVGQLDLKPEGMFLSSLGIAFGL